MDIKLHSGEALSVSDSVFGRDFNEGLVHEVVTAYLAADRQGTKAQKNRAARSGGGKKPWRQKGTGRARAGTIRSPLWRKGGVTFAASPRDYAKKVNRKAYQAAMRGILSELVRQDRLVVVEDLGLEAPKTKLMAAKLQELGVEDGLVVTDAPDEKVYLACRNLPNVAMTTAKSVDPVSLVGSGKVVMSVGAVKMVEEWLS